MKLAFDVARCIGHEVPFGSTYDHPECKTCARAQQTEHNPYRLAWMGAGEIRGRLSVRD